MANIIIAVTGFGPNLNANPIASNSMVIFGEASAAPYGNRIDWTVTVSWASSVANIQNAILIAATSAAANGGFNVNPTDNRILFGGPILL